MNNWAWNWVQAKRELGQTRFDAWMSARKGTRFKHMLTPRVCERHAIQGDAEAIETMERFQAALVTARLKS